MEALKVGLIFWPMIIVSGAVVGVTVYRFVEWRMEQINARAADHAGLRREDERNPPHGDDQVGPPGR